jgi:sulfoxide reductase heme-binding subunit YedZ
MDKMKAFFGSPYLLWLLMAIPAIGLTNQLLQGSARYGMLMHITGEFSVRFLVVSLIASPLNMLFPKGAIANWLLRNRRFFGLAAFAYALLHTIFYILEEPLAEAVNEFFSVGIFTGWVAFFIFVPLAITSTDAAIRRMGANWKRLQRWVYLAALMSLLHWALVSTKHTHWTPALVHFSPFILFSTYRIWVVYFKPKPSTDATV